MNWPANVLKLVHAIIVAEGSNPIWNNPGDLTGSDAGAFQTIGTANAEGVLIFARREDGYNALCMKVARMLAGQSKIYRLDESLAQVGLTYSGGDPNWAINVAKELGVSTETTLRELVNLQ